MDENRIPVIVAVGEALDRPEPLDEALEPVALMEQALRDAERDSGQSILAGIDSLEVVGLVSWRYSNPAKSLCERLDIAPTSIANESMGGETPIRLLHQACLRIQSGEHTVCAIVGGEAQNSVTKARRAGIRLDWTPLVSKEDAVKVDFDRLPLRREARRLGISDPVHIYPFYELALQATEGKTPKQGHEESALLWSEFSEVAATNPCAWIKENPTKEDIAEISDTNRMITFPYPKFMVANPSVNQAAAIIVASLAWAKEQGIGDEQLVFLKGGAAAHEPGDFLERDRYDRSAAQSAVLESAGRIAGGAEAIDFAEFYSCFPVVPKLAARALPLRMDVKPTVTGGLTFFGGPMNNYMSHATCAMVRRVRSKSKSTGLLYGNGGVVSKHHAIVVSSEMPDTPLNPEYHVVPAFESVPPFNESPAGKGTIETYTVKYDPKGKPTYGLVIGRDQTGQRFVAKVREDDAVSMDLLLAMDKNAIGTTGFVRQDTFGQTVWSRDPKQDVRSAAQKYCQVERDGPLTIVTINRPEAMNALHPMANEELAEVFDDFASDPDQWVAILTGAGDRAFSAGNDLKYQAKAAARGLNVDTPLTGFAGLTSRWELDKPVIAAVNGVAMGGGFEIALACDLIIAAENASFALPEPKVGLAALAGGLHRLPRQVGLKQAMGLILTGRRVSAQEGLTMGFINEVCAPSDLMAVAKKWALEILECSPMSIRASKQTVMKGLDEVSVESASEKQFKWPAVQAMFRSSDLREGPRAFAEKRKPVWKGQ